jgi:transcriptional regulator with XRE-family HTH domain
MIIGAITSRAARGLLDWTQAQLAAAARVGLSTVRNFEAGRSLPSETHLFALQRALEDAYVEFLPEGAIRLRPERIEFEAGYRVDRYKFRMFGRRGDRPIIADVTREAVDDAARLKNASGAEREIAFRDLRSEIETCATDLLMTQAPELARLSIDTMMFEEWRRRRQKLTYHRSIERPGH